MPRKDLLSYPKKVGYRKHPGMVAWLLHRITAVIIVLYFFLHMLGSSGVCTFLPSVVQNKFIESIVLVSIVFHALNGMRIILMEFFNASEVAYFKTYFYVVIGLTVVFSVIGIVPLCGVQL